jgi:hypothetical protein
MQRFNNILVVIDRVIDGEALIERAVILGQRDQAHQMVIVDIERFQ